ncbi:MAG TPA: HNH endonuclease [Vicinamibacterales bacterium]
MTHEHLSYRTLSDRALTAEVVRLARDEQRVTAALVAALVEFDTRALYLGEGCASLFVYCTRVLHLSEHAAYGRIKAARTAARFPVILDQLAQGEITVTNVGLLAPILTEQNHRQLLLDARHRTSREVKMMVVGIDPRPDVPCTITPLGPDRFSMTFTMSLETYDKLRQARDLLRHVTPQGDPDVVFGRGLDALLPILEGKKYGRTKVKAPRKGARALHYSRYIPLDVRRTVWARDGGRCTFVGPAGRCTETGLLEFHHIHPFALGGSADPNNITLRCRAHNQYEADVLVGASVARERADIGWEPAPGEDEPLLARHMHHVVLRCGSTHGATWWTG